MRGACVSISLLRKLIFLPNNLIRKHRFPGYIRLPPQRNKISLFTLLFTPQIISFSTLFSAHPLASTHSQRGFTRIQNLPF